MPNLGFAQMIQRSLAEGDGTSTSTTSPITTTSADSDKPDIYENESVEDEMKRFYGKTCTKNTDCGLS